MLSFASYSTTVSSSTTDLSFAKLLIFAQKIYLYTSKYSNSTDGIFFKNALTCILSNLRRSVFTVR